MEPTPQHELNKLYSDLIQTSCSIDDWLCRNGYQAFLDHEGKVRIQQFLDNANNGQVLLPNLANLYENLLKISPSDPPSKKRLHNSKPAHLIQTLVRQLINIGERGYSGKLRKNCIAISLQAIKRLSPFLKDYCPKQMKIVESRATQYLAYLEPIEYLGGDKMPPSVVFTSETSTVEEITL